MENYFQSNKSISISPFSMSKKEIELNSKIQNHKYFKNNIIKGKKCYKICIKNTRNKNNIAINLLKIFIIINIFSFIFSDLDSFSYEILITFDILTSERDYKIYNLRNSTKYLNKIYLGNNEIYKEEGSNNSYYYEKNESLFIYINVG